MRAQESQQFQNQPLNANPVFGLGGGRYLVVLMGTSVSVSLRIQEPDGVFRLMLDSHGNVVSITASSTPTLFTVDCQPGQYSFHLGAGSAGYMSVTRIPLEE